ncbi:MAG TPA: DUF4349 domain-containing protein [Mucilaginibacter sp.]|nr:DUF4349 domain-containing protein [Mucilaginibacter sp.]
MKKLFALALLVMVFTACNHNDQTRKVDQVRFPPPVVKADEEAVEEPPVAAEMKLADPGEKYEKGDPDADIVVNEPVGNADAKLATAGKDYYSPPGNAIKDTSKKIIKTGDISFETKNIAATRKALLNDLKRLGGYLDEDNESFDSDSDRKEYTLKTRIPAINFDRFLDSVSTNAIKIDAKHISIIDVTTRYIDMATRLQNKKLLEARYLDLLKRANKMSDVLEVESKLNEIRTEIESTQGEMNYLNKQIAYSSLDITFYATHINKPVVANTFDHQFSRAVTRGLRTVKNVFFGIIALWPLWIVVAGIYVFVRSWISRRRAANIEA